jgi:hypothetical protein
VREQSLGCFLRTGNPARRDADPGKCAVIVEDVAQVHPLCSVALRPLGPTQPVAILNGARHDVLSSTLDGAHARPPQAAREEHLPALPAHRAPYRSPPVMDLNLARAGAPPASVVDARALYSRTPY